MSEPGEKEVDGRGLAPDSGAVGDGPLKLELKAVPPGSATLGRQDVDTTRQLDSRPVHHHDVCLSLGSLGCRDGKESRSLGTHKVTIPLDLDSLLSQ